jgi:hypothetical protein
LERPSHGYAVAVYSRRAALVYEKLSCVVNCMYLYVLVHTFQKILVCTGHGHGHRDGIISDVLVCTCTYLVPIHTILPDPVQVYRIPDELEITSGSTLACIFSSIKFYPF